ncbi:ECF transporter S component [Bacillus badius]|uniref:Substrate-specific component CblT n=1 Tax=Bacillus badius TaxID=1455 RepID=A0ABR5AQB4_BACBA|nr:ECF transporter S component [Bacillus badius]KIL76956.1 Substrate-specific component CblT [Bacillus badius]MED4717712.1 ECF transporter S component [Bacillus badius]
MSVKHISWLALFTALSVVGGMIKVPAGIVTSVAFDSFPALLAAGLLGAGPGALVAAFGHLISALTGGMPMGPLHLLIAAEMAGAVWLFAALYRVNKRVIAVIVFILLNGLVLPLPFIFVIGWGFYAGVVPSLLVAALLNGLLAWTALPRLKELFRKHFSGVQA